MPHITVNDAEFYYEIHGEGQPLILVSGYTCDNSLWKSILDPLTAKFKVLLFDNRAAGQTKDKGRDLTIDLMADDVIALANKLGFSKPHVAGHSMGGAIVQSIGVRHSENVSKLAIMNSSAKFREAALLSLRTHFKLREKGTDLNTLLDLINPWIYSDFILSDSAKLRELKKLAKSDVHPQTIENQKRQLDALEEFDYRTKISSIKSKTLIICGSEDILALPMEAKFLAAKIPNATLVEIDHAAHATMLEQPKLLTDALLKFFG